MFKAKSVNVAGRATKIPFPDYREALGQVFYLAKTAKVVLVLVTTRSCHLFKLFASKASNARFGNGNSHCHRFCRQGPGSVTISWQL